MAIEIIVTLRCSVHHEEEVSAEVDLKKGLGYVVTCLKCLQEARASQLKVLTDRLLELRTAEDIPVVPHTRKRPRKPQTQEAKKHCSRCNEKLEGDYTIQTTGDDENYFVCPSCEASYKPVQPPLEDPVEDKEVKEGT